MSDGLIFQICGAIIMTVAIFLFSKDSRSEKNSVGLGPLHFSLSAPSLVIFIVGAGLFAFPFTEWFKDRSSDNAYETTNSADGAASNVEVSNQIAEATIENSQNTDAQGDSGRLSVKNVLKIPALQGKSFDVNIRYCAVPADQIRQLVDILKFNMPEAKITFEHEYESTLKGASIMYMRKAKEEDAQTLWTLVKSSTSFKKGWLQPGIEDESNIWLFLMGDDCPQVPS